MTIAYPLLLFVAWVLYGALAWRKVASWCARFDGRSFGFRFGLMALALLASMAMVLGGFAWVGRLGGEGIGAREFFFFLPIGTIFVHLQMVAAGLMWRLGAETRGGSTASEEREEA